MDIVNFDALKAQGRIIDPSQVDPEEDYFILGKYTNHYSTNSQKYTKYPVYAIKAGDVMGSNSGVQSVTGLNTNNTDPLNPVIAIAIGIGLSGNGTLASPLSATSTIPTLQQVLNNNHDLINGNNFQGTDAGINATGISNSIFFGSNAGENADNAYSSNFLGGSSGVNAIGSRGSNFLGYFSGNGATNAIFCNFLGAGAGANTTNAYQCNFLGAEAGRNSTGTDVNAMGINAAKNNTGNNVNTFGNGAGLGNTLSGATIFSNTSMPTYANFAAASAAITVGLGATAGCTYLYHDQATNSIGAVRL